MGPLIGIQRPRYRCVQVESVSTRTISEQKKKNDAEESGFRIYERVDGRIKSKQHFPHFKLNL